MTLRGGPDDGLALLIAVDNAGVRLDVALVHGLGRELPLDHDVGFAEALFDVATLVHGARRNIRRLGRPGVDAAREQGVVNHRRPICHRIGDVQHVGEQLVGHLDCFRRRLGFTTGGRCNSGHRVAAIQHLVARNDRAHQVASGALGGRFGEVGPGDHGLHAGHRRCLSCVNRHDPGVRMRRAQDVPVQHSRQVQVGCVAGLSGDLVEAVVADRTGADPAVARCTVAIGAGACGSFGGAHVQVSFCDVG